MSNKIPKIQRSCKKPRIEPGLPDKLTPQIRRFTKYIFTRCSSRVLQGGELDQIFILSVSDGEARAKTMTFPMPRSEEAEWTVALLHIVKEKTAKAQESFTAPLCWLRLEWVIRQERTDWAAFSAGLKNYKRNYFRSGIAFPGTKEPWLLLTEAELNARACLYPGGEVVEAQVNRNNLEKCITARHGSSQLPDFSDELPIIIFQTDGVFFDAETGQLHDLCIEPREQGRRRMPALNADNLLEIIDLSSHYLAAQIQPDGRYHYGYFPCFGREILAYNTLRHASSTYALLESYEICHQQLGKAPARLPRIISAKRATADSLTDMKERIRLALRYLTTQYLRHYPGNLAYVLEQEGDIKLGANAVTILALTKFVSVFPEDKDCEHYMELAGKLAGGIIAMQQDDGSFVHVLNAKDLSVKEKRRIIYYDGEAAFGLMRLYGITRDRNLIDCVVRAFKYFIANRYEEAHDHWLAYCSNELVKYLPEKQYFSFAVRNVNGFVDFIRERLTTYPTLLELSMAFHDTLLLLDNYPDFQDVLDGFNVAEFYRALHIRANYLVNGFFFPEMAMFYKYPKMILHGMFIRHHAFRVRIDDVEHYLSGFVAYQKFIASGRYPGALTEPSPKPAVDIYTPEALALATRGKWILAPSENWHTTGLSITPADFVPGHMLMARGKNMEKGYLPKVSIRSLILKGGGAVITDDPDEYLDMGVPVLGVANVHQATLDIGKLARDHYKGNVIGITGSAGKTTTVTLLAHVLSAFGKVGQTARSANLPIGIAWNMAVMPQDADYWVLEMAVGRMTQNSKMIRPDIAIMTNIAPAHLEYHHSVENIALKKSQIFEKMPSGGLAVICRDISQYDLIRGQAEVYGAQIVSYGEHPASDIRLTHYEENTAHVQLGGQHLLVTLQARGKHMAMNALAVLAVAQHYKLDMPAVVRALGTFQPVAGRGAIKDVQIGEKNIRIIDETYNANPLSMKAALNAFAASSCPPQHRIAILGDMLELGANSEKYHLELLPFLETVKARITVLCGDQMHALFCLFNKSKAQNTVYWCKNIDELIHFFNENASLLLDGDEVLIKSSHGVELHRLIASLENIGSSFT